MTQLHLVQVGFLRPILDGLKDSGVNVRRLLVSSGLNKFHFTDAEQYVPVHSMYSFFDGLNQQEGLDDLMDQFSEQIQLVSLSQWGEMIAYTPDVLTAIQTAVKYDSVVMSHERAGFEISGNNTKYWQRFTDRQNNGREQADFLSFSLAIKGLQLAAGNDWAPLEIHFQSHIAPNLDILLPPGNNTRVLLGQATTAIVFPTSMLAMPMLGGDAPEGLVTDFLPSITLSSKIENLLSSMQPDLIPNMNLLAEMTESSTRTLQRNLAEEDASLSGVIEQWRFKKAIQLLDNPEIKVKDISEQLGYANAPNFVRAFRRWTGISPNGYREQK